MKLKQLKTENVEILRIFLSMNEEENYCKPVRVSNFCSNNYTECESNGDRNKTLLVEEYLNKIRPYLKKRRWRGTCNYEERVMYLKSNNVEIMINDEAEKVMK